MKNKLIIIVIFGILIFGIFSFTIPIKEVWVEDDYIYGSHFCNTYDGSCIPTLGHRTLEKLTLFEYWKYKRYLNEVKDEM